MRYLPEGGPGIAPIRGAPVMVWRVSAEGPGYFGGDRVYQHVWLTLVNDELHIEVDRYADEPDPYESWLTVHDATTGLRLWGAPREPVRAGMPPPIVMARAGEVVYTVVPGNVLLARDTAAERTLWQVPFSTRIAALVPAPGRLFVLAEGGHLTLLGDGR